MEVVVLCGANLKRSVVAKRVASEEWAMASAHSWSDEEISRLATLVWRKKRAELKKVKKASESKMEGSKQEVKKASESKLKEGSEPEVKTARESNLKEGSEPEVKKVTDMEEEVKMIGDLKLEERSKSKLKAKKKEKKKKKKKKKHRRLGLEPEKMIGDLKLKEGSEPELKNVKKASESKMKEGSEPEVKKAGESKLKEESKPEVKKADIKTDIEALPVDDDDEKVIAFRQRWIERWSGKRGSFESVTMIRAMPFTYHLGPMHVAYPCDTLQIFSVQVAGLFGGLELPLDVFGMVAIRDSVDHNRNLVFFRSRDECQTLTENDPYLALTGPTRTVCLDSDNNVYIEFELKVRGKVESEDRYLSFLAAPVPAFSGYKCIGSVCFMSKCSSLKLAFASVTSSVEATIFIRAIEGSWPDGVHGQITALTPVIEHEKLVLLEFGADDVPVSGDGYVELSRQVVSVALDEELLISYIAWKDGISVEQNALFKPATADGSCAVLQLGTCKLEVLVAWSFVSPEPGATLKWGC